MFFSNVDLLLFLVFCLFILKMTYILLYRLAKVLARTILKQVVGNDTKILHISKGIKRFPYLVLNVPPNYIKQEQICRKLMCWLPTGTDS